MTTQRPTIPMLAPPLSTTRLWLTMPVGLSLCLERPNGPDDRRITYRVLDLSGRCVARGVWPDALGAWENLEGAYQGEQRVRLSSWLRGSADMNDRCVHILWLAGDADWNDRTNRFLSYIAASLLSAGVCPSTIADAFDEANRHEEART